MRDLTKIGLDESRNRAAERAMIRGGLVPDDKDFGVFDFIMGVTFMRAIASRGDGWDHVSISVLDQKRCPYWEEMDAIKRRFFKPTEVVMQLHVAESDHINVHPTVLHLWRPHGIRIPLPPGIMV